MEVKDIKEETVSYFIKEADTARKDYNNRIKNLTNKFFKDNNIPLKVGDRVMVANGKVGTIISLYTEIYKYIHHYNYTLSSAKCSNTAYGAKPSRTSNK